MLNTLLEVLAFALLVVGVFVLAGAGWALVAAGGLLGGYVEMSDYAKTRTSRAPQ